LFEPAAAVAAHAGQSHSRRSQKRTSSKVFLSIMKSTKRSMLVCTGVLAAGVHLVALGAAAPGEGPAKAPAYNRDVRPILSENCFACHGPDKNARKADLRLDQREVAIATEAIVPGRPDKSGVIERIFAEDAKLRMPPAKAHKTLTAAQKETLRQWIASGAAYEPHWAYIAPQRPAVPAIASLPDALNPIDAFIQTTLAAKHIKPNPEADRRTLLRRLSLDLIGIPPTVEEVEAFLKDRTPEAYEKQVDRLLKSPHFGERMAQPWLDVARYADTVGFHGDQNQNVWAYRDYVIDAFNKNKRFDQFTLEQLAGDLLPDPTPEQRTATCFLRLNMMTREGGAQPKEYLAKYTADRVRTVGMAWLGSTFACCECHDHKFDPIKTKDFYSLGAFFADIKQWGVYQNYDYTPNPDLPGWSNDHPWPPEIVVRSPALERRAEKLNQQAASVVREAANHDTSRTAWKNEMAAFLTRHPSGWETPAIISATTEPATARRRGARSAATQAAPSQDKAKVTIELDGTSAFPAGPAANSVIAVRPQPGWLAAARIEFLPDTRFANTILRSGKAATVRTALAVERSKGTVEPLRVRVAIADHYAPRYANGFEIIGVQDGWKLDPSALGKPQDAVFFLDTPVRLAEGDKLRVRLSDNTLAKIRIQTSPLAPIDVQRPKFPNELSKALEDSAIAEAAHLRSTAFDKAAYSRLKEIDAELLSYHQATTPVMVVERTSKPLTIRVLARGNWMDESGEICQPAIPQFLNHANNQAGRQLTRLDLARWLCSPENPLAARVIMNRLWKDFFGAGLSSQVDDLGAQGEPPSHPELLDWLAVEFRESGWDLKHMVKLLVMSHTYRQSSKPRGELRNLDPTNRLLAAQNPRRLDAEFIRDNALAIAGLLSPEMGGPPAKPYQPAGYYDGLQFPDRQYVADKGEREYRRGVYMHWQRTFLHPMLANFDASGREDCIAMRPTANSPQQALTLLNDPEFVEAARMWAGKLLLKKNLNDAERIADAYQRALCRPPTAPETKSLLAFLNRVRGEYRARPADAAKLLHVGLAEEPKGDALEEAAWTSLCRVILNLHETITRY
jgi:hypothetical protein